MKGVFVGLLVIVCVSVAVEGKLQVDLEIPRFPKLVTNQDLSTDWIENLSDTYDIKYYLRLTPKKIDFTQKVIDRMGFKLQLRRKDGQFPGLIPLKSVFSIRGVPISTPVGSMDSSNFEKVFPDPDNPMKYINTNYVYYMNRQSLLQNDKFQKSGAYNKEKETLTVQHTDELFDGLKVEKPVTLNFH